MPWIRVMWFGCIYVMTLASRGGHSKDKWQSLIVISDSATAPFTYYYTMTHTAPVCPLLAHPTRVRSATLTAHVLTLSA